MKRVKRLIAAATIIILSLTVGGCGKVLRAEKRPVITPVPAPATSLGQQTPATGPSRQQAAGDHFVKSDSLTQAITPETASFSIPLYPKSVMISGRQTRGITPQEKETVQSTMDMYSLDSIDEIIRFYRSAGKGLTIREFQTDRGRNVTISDSPLLVPQSGYCSTRATTLILYRDNKEGRTKMTYTGFRLKE